MRLLCSLILLVVLNVNLYGQVGIQTINPDESSVLDIVNNAKGVLISRMTEVQKNNVVNPANGLMIFQTDGTSGYYVFQSGIWTLLDNGTPSVIKVAENGKVGYRFADQLAANHADTGENAINFSQNNTTSTTVGARYDNSITIGNVNLVNTAQGINIGGSSNVSYNGDQSTNSSFSAASLLVAHKTPFVGDNYITGGRTNTVSGNNHIILGYLQRISGFPVANGNILMGTSNRSSGDNSVILGRFNVNQVANTYMLGRSINQNGSNPYQVVTGRTTNVCSDCVFNAQGVFQVKSNGAIVVPNINNTSINSSNKSLISKEYSDATYLTPSMTSALLTGFGTNWSNYGSGWQEATITIKNGQVKLAGLVRKTSSNFTFGETILTLPAGYRPLLNRLYSVAQNNNQLRVDVYPDGRIVYVSGTNGADNYLSLEGIVFRID